MHRGILVASTFLLSWLLMQAVHELGHLLGAWGSGGTVVAVDLHPLRISHTEVRPNPRPLFVVWMGPLVGTILPLWSWAWLQRYWREGEYLLRFFAGFCLIANGAYLGTGVWMPVGDAWDLLQLGVPRWQLGLFGMVTGIVGVRMWDGLATPFGLKPGSPPVRKSHTWGVATLTAIVIFIELLTMPSAV